MERVREITVEIEIDTNKNTYKDELTPHPMESREEFAERIKQTYLRMIEHASD